MNPTAVAVVFALALCLVLVLFVGTVVFNSVIAMGQRADKAWANVEVALQQRHDELPNVVAAVRDVMAYEQDVLEDVTRLRAAFSPDRPVADQAATSAATSRAIRSLFAVVERYPELRSQANVLDLQAEIERLESVIAGRRELYNDMTYRYNAAIGQLPGNLLAPLFGWQARPFFDAEPDADGPPPDVSLHTPSQA